MENLQESRRAGPGGSFTARNRAGLRDTLSPAQKCFEANTPAKTFCHVEPVTVGTENSRHSPTAALEEWTFLLFRRPGVPVQIHHSHSSPPSWNSERSYLLGRSSIPVGPLNCKGVWEVRRPASGLRQRKSSYREVRYCGGTQLRVVHTHRGSCHISDPFLHLIKLSTSHRQEGGSQGGQISCGSSLLKDLEGRGELSTRYQN